MTEPRYCLACGAELFRKKREGFEKYGARTTCGKDCRSAIPRKEAPTCICGKPCARAAGRSDKQWNKTCGSAECLRIRKQAGAIIGNKSRAPPPPCKGGCGEQAAPRIGGGYNATCGADECREYVQSLSAAQSYGGKDAPASPRITGEIVADFSPHNLTFRSTGITRMPRPDSGSYTGCSAAYATQFSDTEGRK